MQEKQPNGKLMIRVVAMPKDTNPAGDIFGGWLLSQMDIAGAVFSNRLVKGRVVTVAMDAISFKSPVYVGDTVCCYASLKKRGRTSICVHVEAHVFREYDEEAGILVTEGKFTYVKVDEKGKPIA
jgi:acyl-CoA thioesterase YciA